jgi:hypothetical protein
VTRAPAFFAFMLIAGAARAGDAVLAETLFREGRAASDSGDLATACAKFAQSYRLDPAPGTLLNLGDCEERRGKLATAWEYFNRLYDTLAAGDDRRTLARSRADAVAARLPRVRIVVPKGAPAGTTVLRDGAPLDTAAIGTLIPIDPGAHVLTLRAPDHRDSQTKVEFAEGAAREVALTVGAADVRVASGHDEHGLGGRRVAGLVLAGVGVLAIGGGFVTGGLAIGTQSDAQKHCAGSVCVDQQGVDLHETAKTEALVADILFGAGALVVVTGLIVFASGSSSSSSSARASVGLGPGSVMLRGVF